MRLFIATDLDDTSRADIAQLQNRLAKRCSVRAAPKWTKPAQMHLTLAFIGEASDDVATRIVAAMDRPVVAAPFEAVFDRVGMFPPRGAPRVLWLGVGDGAAAMVALQKEIAARLETLGVDLERRPFQPHLTLGRWRDARPSDRRAFDVNGDPEVVARVRVDHATLYRSQLAASGSIYTPIARVRLAESGPGPTPRR